MGSQADNQLAQIYRDQWSDYVKRFFPLENELVDTYNNPTVHNRIIGSAVDQTMAGMDAAQGSFGRSMARFGLNQDAQVKQETDRSFNLARTTAVVDAKNRTRQALLERDQAILGGGITTGGMVKEMNQ